MSADEARRLAAICWAAAYQISEAGGWICPKVRAFGSVEQTRLIQRDLGEHLGEWVGGDPSRVLPSGWTQKGRRARVELLSLAAEYYEAVAEGRVRS